MSHAPLDPSLFEALLASFADNVYVFDRELRYAFVGPTAASALGLTPAAVVGRTWRELGLPAAVMEPVEQQVRAVFASGQTIREETLFSGPAGPRYYEYVITPVPSSDGRVQLVTTIGRDVTDRKLAETRRTEVLESMGDAFFALDRDFTIVLVNRRQELVSQTSRKDTIGRNFWEVFPATATENLKYWSAYHRAMQQRVPVEFEEYYAPLDLWTEVRAYPTEDGGISVFFRDVTERKRAEHKLASARAFEERIVAIVGHDIRSPLAAIDLATQMLQRQIDPSAMEARRTVERVGRSVDRIRHIVDDLLDFTRARQGGIPVAPEPTSLEALCRQVLEEAEAAAGDRKLELTCAGDSSGNWDPHRIGQAVSNLVGNAVQHSPPGSHIVVAVEAHAGEVTLRVHNEGHIPPELLPVIFDPFRQGQSAGPHQGLGLGLFIVQTIVQAHGGNIEVASAAAEGTTFTLRLPRERAGDLDQLRRIT